MAEAYFLVHEKTGREYRIVRFDPDKGECDLVGEMNVPFTEKFDKDALKAGGYKLVKKQVEMADA